MTVRILQAVTSVHVGDGTSVHAVELPLARERHTRWPFIPGSSLKGALRERAHVQQGGVPGGQDRIEAVFGSDPPERSDAGVDPVVLKGGSLAVGPAILLALPVRSLHGTFALLTCPTALARLARSLGEPLAIPNPDVAEAIVGGDALAAETKVELGGRVVGIVFLEDVDLLAVKNEVVDAWRRRLGELTADQVPVERLAVVHDDVFAHACHTWTAQRTRNALDDEGVVRDGLLYTVEMLPSETLWFTVCMGLADGLLPADGELFAVGGHQSVGLGRVTWFGGGA